MSQFDLIVIGAGPGGYVAAIAAAQRGKKVAIVEKEALGGVCLNWGCIPTKALLKSAEVFQTLLHARDYGLQASDVRADFPAVIAGSREVAAAMSKGVAFLMKKNAITVLTGTARLTSARSVRVTGANGEEEHTATHLIIATGARPRSFPHLPVDGTRVITYRQAMSQSQRPASLACIGAGAIGMEFGYFYQSLGTSVHIIEVLDQVLPVEDTEVAATVAKAFTRAGTSIRTSTAVERLEVAANGVTLHLKSGDTTSTLLVDQVLVAVGMLPNSGGLGLEEIGVAIDERGFIRIDADCQTSVPGVYAIGDVAGRQLLAHKASFEAEAAVGHLCGAPTPVDYDQIPGCTYCQPQVASIGVTERRARANGRPVKIGRFTFQASGKAKAIRHPEGFVKLIFDAEHEQLIGAHLVGYDVTESIAELALAMKLEATAKELVETVHAHPTLSEAVMEAAADALGHCIHQ